MGINSKGQITFAYGHSFLTADEIEEEESYRASKLAAPLAFGPSNGESDLQAFEASLWASALMAE